MSEKIQRFPTLYYRNPLAELEKLIFTLYKDGNFYLEIKTFISDGREHISETPLTATAINSAVEEAHKVISHFKDIGYTEDSSGIAQPKEPILQPMLAHRWEKHSHKMPFPCFVQPKLDGIRCIAYKTNDRVHCFSRYGNRFETTEHIETELFALMNSGEIWDGELYNHGTAFNRIFSEVSNKSKYEGASFVKYHIFDVYDQEKLQYERVNYLLTRFKNLRYTFPDGADFIHFVETRVARNEEEVREISAHFVSQGYEGAIVRNSFAPYRPKSRTSNILKVKEFQDEEFPIIDAIEGTGKDEGSVIWVCKTSEGHSFNVRPAATYEERRKMWDNYESYLGKKLTVKFFEKSDKGIPRFPVGIRLQD